MVIGILQVDLYLPGHGSLKSKRSVLRSLKDRLRGRFNVSIAELDGMDQWQRSVLVFGVVGSERRGVEATLDHVLDAIEGIRAVDLIEHSIEIL